jgi:A/G-specific adenine glycosylase
LGYNRRALWLKTAAEDSGWQLWRRIAQTILAELRKLPGIGPNTAGSIATFAFNIPSVFIETNIRRVFLYHCFADQ